MAVARHRPTEAVIDHHAIAANVAALSEQVGDRPELMVVVKADAYGHGAVAVAATARRSGARWLGVSCADEGAELREAGDAGSILVLSEPTSGPDALETARQGLTPTVYTADMVAELDRVAQHRPDDGPWSVHLKIDTGMHRVGCHPDDAVGIAEAIVGSDHLSLGGVWTHCPVADDLDSPFTASQLAHFDRAVDAVRAVTDPGLVHAANSATAIAHPDGRHDLCRFGIATYGLAPSRPVLDLVDLKPVMTLRTQVVSTRQIEAGDAVSYGLRRPAPDRCWVATLPVGYADGVPRRLFEAGGEVVIGGRRRPLAGMVTMDLIMVDCGDDRPALGDEAILFGPGTNGEMTADDWADRLGTIGYEIVTRVSQRVARRHVGTA